MKQVFMSLGLALVVLVSHRTSLAAGPAPVDLLSTSNFTILSGAAITSTGGGTINGDVGASPITGAAIGVTDAQVNGTIYAVDSAGPAGSVEDPTLLGIAKGDLTTAYNDARDRVPVPVGDFLNPGGGNMGGLNLVPGLYKFTGSASITGGDLTLTGGPNDVWIFQIASNLVVGADGRQVILAGGARAANVFWQVGTSATIGTFAVFKGTIMADQSIVLDTSSSLEGRALAFEGGVTWNGTSASLPPPMADLSVEKSASPDPVVAGQTLTYLIIVTNNGPDPASNVALDDLMPPQATFVNAVPSTGTCATSLGHLLCDLGTLEAGTSETVELTMIPNSAGVIENTVTGTLSEFDPDLLNNTAVTQTTVNAPPIAADLAVSKTASPDPVAVGQTLTYLIIVTNNGPDPASNVVLDDLMPPEATFLNAVAGAGNCATSAGHLICDLGTLAAGTSATVELTMVPNSAGIIENTVTGTLSEFDPDLSNNVAVTQTTVNAVFLGADLAISKTAEPQIVQSGTEFNYVIVVTNLGPDSATSVVVTDSVPSGITITTSTATVPASCLGSPGSYVCDIGTMAPDETVTLTLTAVASPTTVGQVDNTVTVSSPDSDPNLINNSATATVTFAPAPALSVDLSVTKTDSPDPVFVGRNLLYTVLVRNNGPAVATNVNVTDLLPNGVTFVSATSPGVQCQTDQTTVTCLVPAIAVGAEATVTISVVPQQPGTITNTATAFALDQAELNPADNTAQASTTVNPLPSPCIDLTGHWPGSSIVSCKTRRGRLSCQMRFDFSIVNLCLDTIKKNHCFRVAFYISDDTVFDASDRFIGATSYRTIRAGATVTRPFKGRIPSDLSVTGKYIIGIIDDRNWVPEDIDRSNNTVVFGPIQ